jgi:class 3 adenylate cyclase
MTAAAPSGVVTFLFTDIEGSTRRWTPSAATAVQSTSFAVLLNIREIRLI